MTKVKKRLERLQSITSKIGWGKAMAPHLPIIHLKVDKSKVHGVGVFATKDYKKNEIIIPFMDPHTTFHPEGDERCDFCLKTKEDAINKIDELNRCIGCQKVSYCSQVCQTRAKQKYHNQYECSMFKIIHKGTLDDQYSIFHRAIMTDQCEEHLPCFQNVTSGTLDILENVENEGVYSRNCGGYNQWDNDRIATMINSVFPSTNLNKVKGLIPKIRCCTIVDDGNVQSLYPIFSLFNHSCDNNAFIINRGYKAVLVATKDIKKGEEIFHPYIYGFGKKETYETLQVDYGFKCKCYNCTRIEQGSQDQYYRCKDRTCNGRVDVIINKNNNSKVAICLKCNTIHDLEELENDGKVIRDNIIKELVKAPLEVQQMMIQLYYDKFHDTDQLLINTLLRNNMSVYDFHDLNHLKRQEIYMLDTFGLFARPTFEFYMIANNKYKENNDYIEQYFKARVFFLFPFYDYNLKITPPQLDDYPTPLRIDIHDKFFDSDLYNNLPRK